MAIRVVCYGLGPIGLGIARMARPGVDVVGAVDVDPDKAGRDLGELLVGRAGGVAIGADAAATLAATRPDVVLHATQSSLARLAPQLVQIAEFGAHIVY